MFDINTILTQALAAAVAEATKPLVERIATLEAQLAAHAPLGVVSDGYKVVQEAVYAYLDASESFWHRIECFVQTRTADAVEKAVSDAIENHEEGMSHFDEDDIDTKIEEAIEQHEQNKTHGDDDDIESLVQKLLNSASISITV
jgi:hypothetical protein